ncbi:MAG: heavy metal translocating P-type ATPase [Chlorobiaceae bacterium]
MTTRTYSVKGMHCASCAAIISKKLSKVDGVREVNVNLATEKARLEFDNNALSVEAVNDIISKYGFTFAAEPTLERGNALLLKEEKQKELQTQLAKVRFALPAALVMFILMMWDTGSMFFLFIPKLPIPMELLNIISMVIATYMVFWIGAPFLHGVTMYLKNGAASMDTLIGIGTLTAYVYSAIVTLIPSAGRILRLPDYTYFDVTIVVIGFVLLGKYLEARSKMKTGEAIEKLIGLQAKSALVIREGKEVEIAVDQVKTGDAVIVKPGGKIPVDGIMTEGYSSIDESMVTGESIPVDKKAGDQVIGGTINKQGSFTFTASTVASDTLLARIIRMVEDAQGSKAPIQNMADNIAGVFVPVVLILALATFVIWLSLGSFLIGFSAALSFAISGLIGILVIACPCALGLATPTAIIVGIGKGAEYGILIRNAESLEKLSSVDTVVFDKTGTLTTGSPQVSDIITLEKESSRTSLLQLAASVESRSEHPLAQAIADAAKQEGLSLSGISSFESLEGVGVSAVIDTITVMVRKPDEAEKTMTEVERLQREGKSVVIIEKNGTCIGLIALSDTVKEDAKRAVEALHQKGLKVIMLTGDNRSAADFIAQQVGIDEVISEVMPQEKADKIKELQAKGKKVAMAGDGINDAPALAQADVGIAMATGTDVAMETAGITLLKGDINKVAQAITLSRATMRVIRQNLFWAFIYNIIGIPLAAGAFYPFWGIVLNPVFSGLAMAGSSVSVVSNSLRLKKLSFAKGAR